MPLFQITTTEIATSQYFIEADNAEQAKGALLHGQIDHGDNWRDLGHEDLEIIDIKEMD